VLKRGTSRPLHAVSVEREQWRRAGPPYSSEAPALRVSGTTGEARAEFHNEGSWFDCLDGRRRDSRMP
jgi:hypothetical protein